MVAKEYYDFYTPGRLAQFDLILACGDLRREYLDLFPREWERFLRVNRGNVSQCLKDFWEKREKATACP